MLCSCGRAEASPYGFRALGQWIECCELCADEVDGERRASVFDGSSRFDFWPGAPAAADTRCAWCGGTDDLIGEIVDGGRWWICRRCFVARTGGEPWSDAAHLPRFLADLDELDARYRDLVGHGPDRPDRSPAAEGLAAHALLMAADEPIHVDAVRDLRLFADYLAEASPAFVEETYPKEGPGFRLWFGDDGGWHGAAGRRWMLGHDGAVRPVEEDGPADPAAAQALQEWLQAHDALVELVARDAAVILTRWRRDGALADGITGTPLQHWDLRLTLARMAAVALHGTGREDALDALCGLGYYGDERPDLVPAPGEMAHARWPLHPIVDVPADVARRFPYSR